LLSKVRDAEEAVVKITAKQKKHYGYWQRGLDKARELKKKHDEFKAASKATLDATLKRAAKEKGDLAKKVAELESNADKITAKAAEAYAATAKAIAENKETIKQLDEAKAALDATREGAAKTEGILSEVRKNNAAITAKYEELLKGSDDLAREAARVAEEGADPNIVKIMEEQSAEQRARAAKLAAKLLENSTDPTARAALEQQARNVHPKVDAPPKVDTPPKPDAPPKTDVPPKGDTPKKPGESPTDPSISGAVQQGLREGARAGFAAGAMAISKAALTGFLPFALVGLAIYVGGPMLWEWWVKDDTEAARAAAKTFDEILKDAHAKLSKIQFKAGSEGQQIQQSYLEAMASGFDLFPEMVERSDDEAFINEASKKILFILQQTDSFLDLKDMYATDLASEIGWEEALVAIQKLKKAGLTIATQIKGIVEKAKQGGQQPSRGPGEDLGTREPTKQRRPEPNPNDKGIDVLGERLYLSQYPELDPATRSAAPHLIKKVLLSSTGLSFWDPEGKWGGGYLKNSGTISDQVMRHIKFFMNPRAIDTDWAYGSINNERKLKKFMRKNMPKASRHRGSGYKSTRRDYRKKDPSLANSNNTNGLNVESTMNNREKRLQILEKVASSTNRMSIFTENIDKFADSISKEFYQDALRGLDDQYAKSYYTGLKSMYDQKLGGDKADYKSLYEPHGGSGRDILESSHPNSVVISDAMGNGGLVENLLEQQQHDIGVALSAPSGNFRGKHANLVEALIKIATAADYEMSQEISELVDNATEDIVSILKS
jgi:hypothetical protein